MGDDADLDALILFFSGTGNTWWAAHRLVRALEQNGCRAEACSIEQLSPREASRKLAQADAAGFGYPIYGSDLPAIMKEYMEAMDPMPGKRALVFCTQWLWSGDGARVGADYLTPKGFEVRWGEHVRMPNNVCVPLVPFLPFTSDTRRMQRTLARAECRIQHLAECVVTNRPFRRGFHWIGTLGGCLQRVPFRKSFAGLRNRIGVDRDRCIECYRCVRICPVANLHAASSSISPQGRCILCLRCYNFCPALAVTFNGRAHSLHKERPFQGPVDAFEPEILIRGDTE